MPALVVTATQVLPTAGARIVRYTAAAANTFTAGQAVYDTGNKVAALADADASSTSWICTGIALNGASPGQPVDVLEAGVIDMGAGAAPVNGVPYFLGPVAGAIGVLADVLTGDHLVYIGSGIGSNRISVNIHIHAGVVQ